MRSALFAILTLTVFGTHSYASTLGNDEIARVRVIEGLQFVGEICDVPSFLQTAKQLKNAKLDYVYMRSSGHHQEGYTAIDLKFNGMHIEYYQEDDHSTGYNRYLVNGRSSTRLNSESSYVCDK